MNVHLDPRAEVAFRSLDPPGQQAVANVLSGLSGATAIDWQQVAGAQALQVLSGEQLYSVRAGAEWRLLAKVIAGQLIVQDIFSKERLERISGRSLP